MRHASFKFASAMAATVSALAATSAKAQVLFTDTFDAGNSAANYEVNTANAASDASANFAENYGLLSYQKTNAAGDDFDLIPVPSAPHSVGDSKIGLVMRINDTSNAVNSMSALLKNQNFSGNYTVTYDMWINYNGPATGGSITRGPRNPPDPLSQ